MYNAKTGATYTFNPQLSFDTASIVKATIMATLLWQSQNAQKPLSPSEQQLMVPMIEYSNNQAATTLWFDAGGSRGIESFLRAAGLTNTIPAKSGFWGLTQTTAVDQVALMKLLSYPNPILNPASQTDANQLMQHVVPYEAWGVSAGTSPGTSVSLKNGWLPIGAAGWEINSIGHVAGHGHDYVIAILSRHNPSESYGIQTADHIAQMVWSKTGH